jgi:glutathione S-transferase
MTHSGFPAAAMRKGHHQGWTSTLNRLNDALDPQGTAGTITLLGDTRSSYTRTARMALVEKGVAYTMHSCGPHTAEIEAVHPFGLIPGLRDGDITLWETAAIVQYLDECFDTGVSLRPGSISARARCTQWISAVNGQLYDTMVRRYVLQIIAPKGEGGQPDRSTIDKALNEMKLQFSALDKAYREQDYLAGDSLSAADLFLAPILDYVRAMPEGGALMAQFPNLVRAHATIRARPSFTAMQQ